MNTNKLFKYTEEQVEFLRVGFASLPGKALTLAFNQKFNLNLTERQIRSKLHKKGITCDRKQKWLNPSDASPEQLKFLRENYHGRSAAEMTTLFNEHFSTSKSLQQIINLVSKHGIISGRTGHFKKGSLPFNVKPIGHEMLSEGYIKVKIAKPNPRRGTSTSYKSKHLLIWEEVHGKVPDGMIIAFRDCNKLNCEIDNLMLLSKTEMLNLISLDYKEMPSEVKPSLVVLAKLKTKISSRRNERRN